MHSEIPTERPLSRRRSSCVCAVACAGLFIFAHNTAAQDIAEGARQEAARKAAQSRKQTHVYTNEDLSRPQILTPEDRAPIEARRKNNPKPVLPENSPSDAAAQQSPGAESLGEIARRLRSEKAARQAEQARRLAAPAPFPMDLRPQPALAHPEPSIGPLLVPAAPKAILAVPRHTGITKRDPFRRVAAAVPSAASISTGAGNSITSATVSPSFSPPLSAVPVIPSAARHEMLPPQQPNRTIQSGDTLWNLSRQYLGRGSRWPELVECNPDLGNPRRMKLGALLRLPPNLPDTRAIDPNDLDPEKTLGSRSREPAVAKRPSGSLNSAPTVKKSVAPGGPPDGAEPGGVVQVQSGDSLWRIAAQHYGTGSEWPCLAAANPALRNVDRIYPGQQLNLPAACTPANPPSQP